MEHKMISNEWLILQLLFPLLVILVNITIFHYLHGKWTQKNSAAFITPRSFFDLNWKKVGISLSFSHVLSGACLLITAILSLLIHHFVGYYSFMKRVEAFVLLMAVINNMFHIVIIMINDYKRVNLAEVLPGENNFFIVVTWISTALSSLLLFFVQSEHEITQIFSILILTTDTFLFICYIEIIRRTVIEKYREQNHLIENENDSGRVISREYFNQHYLFLGLLLATSFFLFTIPFAVERLLWQQNHVVSYICVTLNATLQGVIYGIRIYTW